MPCLARYRPTPVKSSFAASLLCKSTSLSFPHPNMDLPLYLLILAACQPLGVLYATLFWTAFALPLPSSKLQRWIPFGCSFLLFMLQCTSLALSLGGFKNWEIAACCATVISSHWTMASLSLSFRHYFIDHDSFAASGAASIL